jgi:hypothetical protein
LTMTCSTAIVAISIRLPRKSRWKTGKSIEPPF